MKQHPSYKAYFPGNFTISHNISTGYSMHDYHFHDVFEVYYALSECMDIKYFVEDKIYPVQKGDLFIFNHMDMHKTVVPDLATYERYVITFAPEYVQELSTEATDLLACFMNRNEGFSHRIDFQCHQSYNLLSLFQKAQHYHQNHGYGHDVHARIILIEILLAVNELYQNASHIFQPLPGNQQDTDRIKEILAYIHQNLTNDLSLNHLANHFYISKYHLGSIFKKATGFAVTEYIINRRILKARELLKKNLPVYQVCEKVGFNNYAHFIRTFTRLVGISPKQYAKR